MCVLTASCFWTLRLSLTGLSRSWLTQLLMLPAGPKEGFLTTLSLLHPYSSPLSAGKKGAHGEGASAGVLMDTGTVWSNGDGGAGSSSLGYCRPCTFGKGASTTLWWQKPQLLPNELLPCFMQKFAENHHLHLWNPTGAVCPAGAAQIGYSSLHPLGIRSCLAFCRAVRSSALPCLWASQMFASFPICCLNYKWH